MLNRESIYAKCNCKYHQKLRLQIVSVYYEFISIHPTGKKEENQGMRQRARKKGTKRERKINRVNSKRKLIADAF